MFSTLQFGLRLEGWVYVFYPSFSSSQCRYIQSTPSPWPDCAPGPDMDKSYEIVNIINKKSEYEKHCIYPPSPPQGHALPQALWTALRRQCQSVVGICPQRTCTKLIHHTSKIQMRGSGWGIIGESPKHIDLNSKCTYDRGFFCSWTN